MKMKVQLTQSMGHNESSAKRKTQGHQSCLESVQTAVCAPTPWQAVTDPRGRQLIWLAAEAAILPQGTADSWQLGPGARTESESNINYPFRLLPAPRA